MKWIFILVFFFFIYPNDTHSHSGGLNGSGCHNCYTSECAGEYHCHNGGSGGSTYNFAQPRYNPTFDFPDLQATYDWTFNKDGTMNLILEANDPRPTKYSAVISKCKGCDPGPNVDFYTDRFIFSNIKPGSYYLNAKKEVSGYWSNVGYWEMDTPDWMPPSPTPLPTIAEEAPTPYPTSSLMGNFTESGFTGREVFLISSLGGLIAYTLFKSFNK